MHQHLEKEWPFLREGRYNFTDKQEPLGYMLNMLTKMRVYLSRNIMGGLSFIIGWL